MTNQLKQDLKRTLNNDICRFQSLDNVYDRNRVLKQIIKTLEENYTWHPISRPQQKH